MMFEQRRTERYELFDSTVEYSSNPFSEGEIREAGVVNFNESGLCLLSSHRLSVGQEISVRNFMTYSSRTAKVVWAKKYDDIFHLKKSGEVLFKIGLLFV